MQSKSGFCSQPNLSPDQRQVSWIEERYLQVLKALDYHCYFVLGMRILWAARTISTSQARE